MRTLLVLTALCSSAVIAENNSRESRNLDWLFGGFSLFGAPSSELAENIKTNDQRIKLQNKSFQRRTSKIEPDESRGLPRGRVLNRPPPPRVGGPVKGYQPPKRPPPSFQRKPNVAAPIIISSYASTSIQGRGQDDEERIRDKIDKISQYDKLNDISTDDVEQKEEEVKVEESSETDPDPVTETEEIPTTTLRTEEATTTKSSQETTTQEVENFDIIEDSASPYLPVIPEALDDDIHGVHLAGYQEVPEVKANTGVDRTEQALLKKKINKLASVFPLGKPQPKPLAPGAPGRPSFKPSNKQRLPVKPAASQDGSIFDFLPFWGASREQQEKKPRRPIGPQPPPAPPSRPVQEQPREDLPVRSEVAEQPSISSRIDSSSSITEDEEENDVQAYIVLPSQELKPNQEKASRVKIGPKRPTQPFNGPRLPAPRPRLPPPPPPPRPLLGLPRAPATRKQAPFIGKRPLLPPKVPTGFAGAPLKTPFLKTNSAPQDTSRTSLKKPLEKLFKKGESLSPKVIAKLTSQTAVQGKKPFDFRPNGSTEKQSQISSHLSSIMNFLFQTTPSPAPAPSLPSLVEDTEFADIVNGYKPSDKNISESVDGGKENEISTTTPTVDLASKTVTTLKPLRNLDKDDIYDELDSLTAPVPDKKQNIKKFIKSKRPPPPPPPAQFSQKRPAFRPKLKLPAVKIPTTTTTASTLPPVSTTVATTRRPTTTPSPSPSPSPRRPAREQTTTLPGPIQALVSEYQQKGHVVSQETYPKPVLMAIKKNFEHKKNIFSQFVTFSENDKAFIPNKEVVSSDWAVDSLHSLPSSDKILVYQTLPPSASTPPPPPPPPAVTSDQRRASGPTFPDERNAEGGFKPMLRPLHSPLAPQLNK